MLNDSIDTGVYSTYCYVIHPGSTHAVFPAVTYTLLLLCIVVLALLVPLGTFAAG